MLIPTDSEGRIVFRQSHAESYGAGGLELIPGWDEPGCPSLFEARYVTKSTPPRVDAWAAEFGTAAHSAAELMETHGLGPEDALMAVWPAGLGPDRFDEALRMFAEWLSHPDDIETVGLEVELVMPLFVHPEYGRVYLGGKVDRIGIDLGDPRTIYFDDRKTKRRRPSYAELSQWLQGKFYAALVRHHAATFSPEAARFESVEIVGRYDAMKHYRLDRTYSDAELDVFLSWAAALANTILNDEAPRPVLNPVCGWCPIRRDCEAWRSLPGEGESLAERLAVLPLEDRAALSLRASAARLALQKMEDTLKGDVREKVETEPADDEGVRRWETDRIVAEVKPSSRRVVVPALAHETMGDDAFYRVASVSVKAMEEWAEDQVVDVGRVIRTYGASRLTIKAKEDDSG